jgi:hypothetical protein
MMKRQLQFVPATGPWSQWRDEKSCITLARGWLASDEPAVFVLDKDLQQLWHAPLPISDGADRWAVSVTNDPITAQPLWVVAGTDATVHFFRGDGQLVDHCQLSEPIRGIGLIPSGNELHLWVAHERRLVQYRVKP